MICILNISEYKLTLEEKNCLYRGLKFHILPKKIDSDNVKIQVESLIKRCFNEKENLSHNLKFELNGITRNFINRAKQICQTKQNAAFHETLCNLRNKLLSFILLPFKNFVKIFNFV